MTAKKNKPKKKKTKKKKKNQKSQREDTALFHSTLDVKGIWCWAIKNYGALHSLMKGRDDVKESRWTSNLGKYFKKAIPANQIKGLCEIYEGHKEWPSLFPAFLLQLSEGEYHVSSRSISSKSTLWFWTDSVCKHLESLQYNTGKQFPYNAETRDATVGIYCSRPVSFVLIQCDNVCILHVLWYSTFPPAKTKDFIQFGGDGLFTALQHSNGDVILSRCLAGGEGIQGRFYFCWNWLAVKFFKTGRHSVLFSASSVTTFSLEYSSE